MHERTGSFSLVHEGLWYQAIATPAPRMIIARCMSVFDGPGQVSKLSEELQSLLPLHPNFGMIDVNRALPPSKILDLIHAGFRYHVTLLPPRKHSSSPDL